MREVVQKVYKFNELEKKVQEEVLERYRYTWVESLDWGEYTEYDFIYTMFSDHDFVVDKDSVSFSMYDAEEGTGFTGKFKDAQAAINVAETFDTKGCIKTSVLDEIRKHGEVRVAKYSWVSSNPRSWNTYIELLIDGIPMEEDEKYAYFIDALEEWRKEECERLYENAEADYEYYTCDNYIRTELAEGNYEFLADGTDF